MNCHSVKTTECKYDLPVQVNPSPTYPFRQVHAELPGVLKQAATALHPPWLIAHSSTSTSSQVKMSMTTVLSERVSK